MIYIGKPFIQEHKGAVRLVSHIVNEGESKELDLYYSVEPEYSKFLTHEQADAFVVPLLLRAAITRQDISVDAPVSERLLHNLQNGVMYSIAKMVENTDLPFVNKHVSNNQDDKLGRPSEGGKNNKPRKQSLRLQRERHWNRLLFWSGQFVGNQKVFS